MGQLYKLGKGGAVRDPRTLCFAKYTAKLPSAPLVYNLTSSITDLGMMLNDNLGDCTCACVGHQEQQWTAENKNQTIIPDADILKMYQAVGGYVPGDPSTDNGAVVLDVLNYWTKNSIGGRPPLHAFAYLNRKHASQIRDTIYYFGNAYIGVQLPITAQNQTIWDVTSVGIIGDGKPGSWGGHAIPLVAYDETYIYFISWGQIMQMTWHFFSTYVDEGYVCLSQDWINASTKLTPENFDFTQLETDVQLVRAA